MIVLLSHSLKQFKTSKGWQVEDNVRDNSLAMIETKSPFQVNPALNLSFFTHLLRHNTF